MASIVLREVVRDNWRATLQLAVHPDQQRFIADYVPIAAIALAKAFIRPDGLIWVPYAIYADAEMVGFIELAYALNSRDRYWVHHFFIDHRHQGKGYGKAALQRFIQLVKDQHRSCQQINLTVHAENRRAQGLYTGAGFRPTGEEQFEEPVYMLRIRDPETL
jgi:diamine N-acetyltransferase